MKLIDRFLLEKAQQNRRKTSNLLRKIRLSIPAQGASMAPPFGPALGQFGLNIVEFSKQFNDKSKVFDQEIMLNVIIVLYRDKTFSFQVKPPSIAFLLYENEAYNYIMKKKNIDSDGDAFLDFDFPRKIPLSLFYKIAKYKNLYEGLSLRKTCESLNSTLKSMGVVLENDIF